MRKSIAIFLAAPIFVFGWSSCQKQSDKNISDIPLITNQGQTMHSINLSVDTGDWIWNYDFEDGNGDLGSELNTSVTNVFVKNLTTGATYGYPFPYVPQSARSGKSYLKGSGKIRLDIQTFFVPRNTPAGRDKDTFSFSFFIKDEAGNSSNVLISDPVYVSY